MQTFQLTDHFHIPRLLYEKLILQTISALVILYFPRRESILSRIAFTQVTVLSLENCRFLRQLKHFTFAFTGKNPQLKYQRNLKLCSLNVTSKRNISPTSGLYNSRDRDNKEEDSSDIEVMPIKKETKN